MSFVEATPDIMSGASAHLSSLATQLRNATATVASRTTGVLAPGADEVSEAITAFLRTQAGEFGVVHEKALAFHNQFANLLDRAAVRYVAAEVVNAEHMLVSTANLMQELPNRLFAATAQAASAAAANPAETVMFPFSLPLGPFEIYSQPTYGGDVGVRLNTPLGSLTLFSEGLVPRYLPDGSAAYVFHLGNPLAYVGGYSNSTQTGFFIQGLTFSWPGPSILGGNIPAVSYFPWPGPPLFYTPIYSGPTLFTGPTVT